MHLVRRSILRAILAGVVALPVANAIAAVLGAMRSGTGEDWLLAAGHTTTAGIVLLIALGLLRLADRPTRRPLWLLDRRVLLRRRTAVVSDGPARSQHA